MVEFRFVSWGEGEMYVHKAKAEKNEYGQVKINYLEKGKDEWGAFVEIWARILGRTQVTWS